MNVWFALMLACYTVGIVLWTTAVVRVHGDHWRTSHQWITAGWCAYAVGLIFASVGWVA